MCTDFLLFFSKFPQGQGQPPKDIAVSARSMEFFGDTKPNIEFTPAGTTFTSNGGETWEVKYSYIDINAADQKDVNGNVIEFTNDGQNVEGLSVSGLWLAATEYVIVSDPVEQNKPKGGVHFSAFADRLLGNYTNVEDIVKDVRAEILTAWVGKAEADEAVKAGQFIPPIHYSIHDRNGNSAVIEFIREKAQVHWNHLHVLTNDPPFPWHQANVKYYTTLSAQTPIFTEPGTQAQVAVVGANLRGIPGDPDSGSRFVRTFYLRKFSVENQPRIHLADGKLLFDAPNLAGHLLNTVDIPLGIAEQYQEEFIPACRVDGGIKLAPDRDLNAPATFAQTRWALVKDLVNNKFYYRTYLGYGFKVIDLNKVDWKDTEELTTWFYKMENLQPVDALPLPREIRKQEVLERSHHHRRRLHAGK